jgi:succinate dehydrogenase / fumarate reductase flavoprotein subunit
VKLVNPANKRKYDIIVVGAGLAGASAAATLGELGYNVKCFVYHDSPRRAHSIAAQGGINAAKNYQNDGDSIYRLFYDTIKGGDYRAREGNVPRLADLSAAIIDLAGPPGIRAANTDFPERRTQISQISQIPQQEQVGLFCVNLCKSV